MGEQTISDVGPDRIDVAYERFGSAGAPPVLLIMGVGTQMLGWDEGLCEQLAGHGLQVIRFDNRDVGRSTHLSDAPKPNLLAALAGDLSSASYTLSSMAADTAGLLSALQLDSAHIVGASMGGMIAQTLAIEHPDRIRSLVSIMSTTGDRAVGQPRPEALALFGGAPILTRADAVERAVAAFRVVGSPAYELDEARLRTRAGLAYDRNHDPLGVARQAVAVVASGDRTAALAQLRCPTLVIHGADDPMCDVSGGRATAAAIPGAELVVIDGMGHDLPPPLWPRLTSAIAEHVQRAEARRG